MVEIFKIVTITPTPIPTPTPEIIYNYFILGLGPLSFAELFIIVILGFFVLLFMSIIFSNNFYRCDDW
jgi:hypothetical protein